MKKTKSIETRISKEQFIKIMNALEKQRNHDLECAEAFGKIFPNSEPTSYDNSLLTDGIVTLLQELTFDTKKDKYGYTWITYFMEVLNFGKNYKIGNTIRADGSTIAMDTAGKLFNYLVEVCDE